MFNSPIDWCPACKQWVALDDECRSRAIKNDCPLTDARSKAAAAIGRPLSRFASEARLTEA